MSVDTPVRRVERVRHEPRSREVEVLRTEPVGASFVRITFGGESLADFNSQGFDDHVKFGFLGEDGELMKRDYTPRTFDRDRRELTIEFLVKGNGEGSRWAARARPRTPAVISGPKNSMVIPADYDWHLLVGDATAMPAINRRLEELPSGTRAFVIAQATDPADHRDLTSAAELDVEWVGPHDDLVEHVRSFSLPDGDGFVWAAGEATTMARLRQLLTEEKRHPREGMRVAAYWRAGEGQFHETLEPGLDRSAA